MICQKSALIVILTSLATVLAVVPSSAQNPASLDDSADPVQAGSKVAFSFFGFINWGYGIADGHAYRGVPEDGTADLHTVALQFRLNPTNKDEFVLQLANERVGTSPSNELRDDLELDWLYYRRTLSDHAYFRVGRVPLPIGIYNEVKDVGTLLPFYRASGVYYGDGTWTSDSVDGIVFTYESDRTRDWSFDTHLYYGEWERIETSGGDLSFDVADIEDAGGIWTWINTPVDGLRVGLGYNHFHATGGVFLAPGVTDSEETRYVSIDANFDPVSVRVEYSRRSFTGGDWTPWYAEIDVKLTDRLNLAGRFETADLYFEVPFFATFDGTIEDLYSVGLRYAILPELVVKAEYQWFEGFGQIEDQPLNIFFDDPVETELSIVSLAWSF